MATFKLRTCTMYTKERRHSHAENTSFFDRADRSRNKKKSRSYVFLS